VGLLLNNVMALVTSNGAGLTLPLNARFVTVGKLWVDPGQ
jgi:hypothetical protein